MTTPEGRVKAKVRELLRQYDGMYLYMPVPTGFGQTTLDFLGCYRGRFFSIETKAEGKQPTLRQMTLLQDIDRAMGRTFIISGVNSPVIDQLREWLNQLTETIDDHPYLTPDPVHRRPIP